MPFRRSSTSRILRSVSFDGSAEPRIERTANSREESTLSTLPGGRPIALKPCLHSAASARKTAPRRRLQPSASASDGLAFDVLTRNGSTSPHAALLSSRRNPG